MSNSDRAGQTPRAAFWLGAAGLIPFAAASAAIWIVPGKYLASAVFALVAYGAVILSFMGAVHWGLVIASSARESRDDMSRWLSLGVIPALLAWLALLIGPLNALFLLLAAFTAVYALDRMAIAAALAPPWYGRLRLRLTAAVLVLLLVGAAGVALRIS